MRIGFIGAGQMARALANGFVKQGLVKSSDLMAADCSDAACRQFERDLSGSRIAADSREVIDRSDLVFLAVKPQHVRDVAKEVGAISADTLFVSIAAGVTLGQISELFVTERVVRVMPNTPCLIGKGASGFCTGPAVTSDDEQTVQRLLDSVGVSFRLPESLLDVVTGLSGSGPAFVYQFIEALSDGGVHMGLPRDVALRLAAQTVAGAADMVQATGEHPAVLKDRVASPGGTTIAGIDALEQGGFRGTVMSAVRAATERSRELGRTGG